MTAPDDNSPSGSKRAVGADSGSDRYIHWKDWPEDDFGRYDRDDELYFQDELSGRLSKDSRVLEIGFGNGAFLQWASDCGATVHGVETNPVLVERAARRFGQACAHSSTSGDAVVRLQGTFTHIVAFDVLEHVSLADYPSLFSQFASLLAPNGRCVLRFPNGDSPFGRRVQHGDPTHVTTIGRALIEYFAVNAGLVVEAVRAPALPVRGVGLKRLIKRRLVLATRYAIESVIGAAYYGQRIPLDQNYTAILRRP